MSRQFRSDDTDKWKYNFGDGHDGNLTINSGVSYAGANAGCSGSSGGAALTIDAASTFANNDLVLIWQSRGTGVGAWELNKILSGGGTTSLTMAHNLQNTYTDSGNSQAQIIEIKEYDVVTITTGGTLNPPQAWDGNKGGIIAFTCKTSFTQSAGAIDLNGDGFTGGIGQSGTGRSFQGEGTAGAQAKAQGANGNGGGGGDNEEGAPARGGGGGGGHANAGNAGATNSGGSPGAGGSSVGHAELTSLNFGGGGGGVWKFDGTSATGARGGGVCVIFAPSITFSGGTAQVNGLNASGGVASDGCGSGGGAGGSFLLKGKDVVLGSSLLSATGGTGSSQGGSNGGGDGSVGRIHIDYSVSYSGTTTPTIDVTQDATLDWVPSGASFLFNFV